MKIINMILLKELEKRIAVVDDLTGILLFLLHDTSKYINDKVFS